jgi:hypothetical protein
MDQFKVGDRVRHVELIFRNSGTVTKVLENNEHLGHTYQVHWDNVKKPELNYGAYLRPFNVCPACS